MRPSYLALHDQGELVRRSEQALASLSNCRMCPRECGVDRTVSGDGFCKTGRYAHLASYNLHFGEESPLVGGKGSGTIFFAGCNLGCLFCQNHDISNSTTGFPTLDADGISTIMLELQSQGALNINLVTPSHVTAQILEALPLAVDKGLNIPIVYNSSGYDTVKSIRLLCDVVDIYMPDIKFADSDTAYELARASNYPSHARKAILEMHHQVGDLALDNQGIAQRGLLVRHLLMPNGLAGTESWMRFLSQEISTDTYLNIMDQYRPCYRAHDLDAISRSISKQEYEKALAIAQEHGLTRLDDRQARITLALHRLIGP